MPPRKGQRQARGIARQQQIVDAAFELFATRGYRSTSLARIAAALGITEQGVLHHFPHKDALLTAVLAHRDTRAVGTELDLWGTASRGGVATLRRIAETAQVLLARPELARFDVVIGGESLAEDGPSPTYFRKRLRDIRTVLAWVISAGIERGEIEPGTDAEAVALEVVAFMDGIQTQWLLDPDAVDLEAAYRRYFGGLADRLGVAA
jgi:AcrR family transcriptional regulator